MIDAKEQERRARIFGQRKWDRKGEVPRDEKEAGFLPWEFECIRESFFFSFFASIWVVVDEMEVVC